GGSLSFNSPTAISLGMGTGVNTAYVAPNPTATISVNSRNHTSDTINLALADAQNYALNGTASSGSVTSDNLGAVTYSGFAIGPNVDDVAPAVVDQAFNYDVPTQDLSVAFNKDVST